MVIIDTEEWKEAELEPTWDEKPEGIPIDSTEYAEPTPAGDMADVEEAGEDLEESRETLGEAFEKDKLGSYREAATA